MFAIAWIKYQICNSIEVYAIQASWVMRTADWNYVLCRVVRHLTDGRKEVCCQLVTRDTDTSMIKAVMQLICMIMLCAATRVHVTCNFRRNVWILWNTRTVIFKNNMICTRISYIHRKICYVEYWSIERSAITWQHWKTDRVDRKKTVTKLSANQTDQSTLNSLVWTLFVRLRITSSVISRLAPAYYCRTQTSLTSDRSCCDLATSFYKPTDAFALMMYIYVWMLGKTGFRPCDVAECNWMSLNQRCCMRARARDRVLCVSVECVVVVV